MRKKPLVMLCLAAAMQWQGIPALAQKNAPKPAPPLAVGAGGRLVYTADSVGNRIPDYSYAGYMAGEQPIPMVPVKRVVPLVQGDATAYIQAAIDEVANLTPDQNGHRGTVLLLKGTYKVTGALRISASGIVLRGSGSGPNGTILLGEGPTRETLLTITGRNDSKTTAEEKIADSYIPVNAQTLRVSKNSLFKTGDRVFIRRPSTLAWIKALGTDHFGGGITALGWKPGDRDITWDRTITAVSNETITLDAPLTTALDTAFGGGFIARYDWPGRLWQCGIENMQLVSAYDTQNPKDEDHRWNAISIENAADCWVRQVNFRQFAGSAVAVWESAKRITVEDCLSLEPVSELGGWRRRSFFTAGQQTLFQRCYANNGMNDFSTGLCAAGPNAFVQCVADNAHSFSGGTDSWSSGLLMDIVQADGQAISFMNRSHDGNGAGWNAANSMLWNCSASRIDCYAPPTAQNWSFGSWAQFYGNGYWAESNNHLNPRSLYYAQLSQRLGKTMQAQAALLETPTEASSSPTVEQASELTALSQKPPVSLRQWIESAAQRNPLDIAFDKKVPQNLPILKNKTTTAPKILAIQNGWLTIDNAAGMGGRLDVPWWSGSIRPNGLKNAKPHITRFVPGKTGQGLTDDLENLTDSMAAKGILAMDHNYGLWYDRRRDDHERIRRIDGDVWPPFYELPFARSGQGTAWDGLSQYDLSKPNQWYWGRLKQFAHLAAQKGLVLIQQHYFQHNIIEAGAHYADFPWRTANNINSTGFPEPVPYAGDKRIFMDQQFYDVTNEHRRQLHRQFIRQSLSNFPKTNNVVHCISAEYTGPLHFVKFWLDVIKEWETETGHNAIIALSTTKDVQDAILADPASAAVVDVIDIRYWHYQQNGELYAPQGGQHLAPRQHARLLKPKSTSPEQVYRAVLEYKQKFPEKAVMYSADNFDRMGWPVLMAGGSFAPLATLNNAALASQIATMQPIAIKGQWLLKNDKSMLYYFSGQKEVEVNPQGLKGNVSAHWLRAKDGTVLKKENIKSPGTSLKLQSPVGNEPVLLWLQQE